MCPLTDVEVRVLSSALNMKDRWCEKFICGKCHVSEEEGIPSMAEEVIIQTEPEKIILTDENSILNFLQMHGFQDNISLEKIPKKMTVSVPKTTMFLRCSASNCRNKQKKCSHYK